MAELNGGTHHARRELAVDVVGYPQPAGLTRTGWVTIGLAFVLLLASVPKALSQTVVWSKSAYAMYTGDAIPYCDISPRAANQRALDGAGNLFVTGCASNGVNNDIITYKVDGVTGAVLWSATYNGSANGDDAGLAAATDSNGHVVITGYSRDVIGGMNIRTIKYHGTTGAEIWNSSFNDALTSGLDQGGAVAIDSLGNVVVTGRSQPSVGNTDIRTIKYDGATGLQIWSVKFDSSTTGTFDTAKAIAVDASGHVVVVGASHNSSGVPNMRTIKYNGANGTEMWNKSHVSSGDGFAEGNSVAIDGIGNVVVTGTCRSGNGGTEICTFKHAGGDGALLWATSFIEANTSQSGKSVAIDASGNIVVSGCSGADCNSTNSTDVNRAMRTIKYNSSGSQLWTIARQFPGDAHAHVIDSSGNVIVAGYGNPGFKSMVVVKYNAVNGFESWGSPFTFSASTGQDEALAVAVDATGNVLIVGKSRDPGSRNEIRTIKVKGVDGAVLWNTTHLPVTSGALPAHLPFSSKAMGVDVNGNVIVTGYNKDSGIVESMRTVKYDASGNEVWNVGYKGDSTTVGTNRGNALVVDGAGNVFVTGVSSDLAGGKNIRTIKYAAATGAPIWNERYEGSGGNDDEANAITLDPSGNVIVTGVSQDLSGGRNMRTIKYNGLTGAVLWTSVYSSNYDDAGYSVATDAGGNVFVTGYSKDANPFSINIRTVKYAAANGAELWTNFFPGPGNVTGRSFSIAVDGGGNPVVAATSLDGSESENFRTIKYNSVNGAELWNVAFNGSSSVNDAGAALAIDSSGDVVVTGMSKDEVGAASTFSMRTLKYRGADGVLLWSAGYAGAGGILASGTAVAIDSAKNPFVTGYSTDPGQGTNIRTIKYAGSSGVELMNIAYAGSADAGDAGYSVVSAIGPGNSIHVLGVAAEAGKPDAWVVRKINDDSALGAPTAVAAIAGNGQATITFQPPVSDGGLPVTSYTVTCTGGFSNTAATSPITVTGLMNDTNYSCSVNATNANGPGPASVPVSVTPILTPTLALFAVKSRKTHGSAGTFDLTVNHTLPINGLLTVEPRTIGTGHKIVFQFNDTVTSIGTVSATDANPTPIGAATAIIAGNNVDVTLTGVPDNQRVRVSFLATGVNGTVNAAASVGYLVGDVTNSRVVTAADISGVKAHILQAVSAANFRFDVDASGSITQADLTATKARSGLALP